MRTTLTIDDAIKWHQKTAKACQNIADDPHFSDHVRDRARVASTHHYASAAGLNLLVIQKWQTDAKGPTEAQD